MIVLRKPDEVRQARLRSVVFTGLLVALGAIGCMADPNNDGGTAQTSTGKQEMNSTITGNKAGAETINDNKRVAGNIADSPVNKQNGTSVPDEVRMTNSNGPTDSETGYPPDPPDFSGQSQQGSATGQATGSEQLTAISARKMVESTIRAQAPSVVGYRLTPPLPASFPYNESAQLVYFAYKADAGAGGIINYSITGPLVEVRLDWQSNQQPRLSLISHTGQMLGEQASYPGELDREQMDAATDVLFRSFDSSPDDADLERLDSVYSLWRKQNPLIAEEIAGRVPALFQWINSNSRRHFKLNKINQLRLSIS